MIQRAGAANSMRHTPQLAAVLLLLVAAGLQQTQAGVDWQWRVGRAT
jgi:hypothetical protein